MASGATYAQRLDGSRILAIHTKYRDFATFFIGARAEISVAESRLVLRSVLGAIRRVLLFRRNGATPRGSGAAGLSRSGRQEGGSRRTARLHCRASPARAGQRYNRDKFAGRSFPGHRQ
ncbi:hypothetical protein LOK49_LG13G00022 [Camellia lanceoleosa]|uniref:Uncharacterized protein n=1 Tax=Camellia lanceoleosa TaxID=1840588 RepID=A0ACC0FH64_9ERIC|nr:hypothetical protein LOK49_LG13G00022 [Camellia lanceoleosa]